MADESKPPLERARWFVERAGARRGDTAPRLQAALDAAHNIPDSSTLGTRLIDEAFDVLALRFRRLHQDRPRVVAVDPNGNPLEVESLEGSLGKRAFGPVARVRRLETPWAFLGIALGRVRRARANELRLLQARERLDPIVIQTSAYDAETGLLIAVITSAGNFQTSIETLTLTRDWEELGPTLDPASRSGIGRVTQLDIHPTNGQILVAASAGGGVWRTDNGGTHWRPMMDNAPWLTMGAVAIAPSNPGVIYAASGEDARPYDPAWPGRRVYRSDNGGTSWSSSSPSRRATRFSEIAVHPWKARIAYVAANVGLFRTRDGGTYWKQLLGGRVTSVVINHDSPKTVFAGVYRHGIYRSHDGYNFTRLRVDPVLEVENGKPHGYVKLAIGRQGAHGGDFVIAKLGEMGERLYVTTDGGNTWTEGPRDVATSDGFAEWTSVIAVSPTDEDVLYAGQRFTLKRSTNGINGPWKDIGAGLHPDHQDLVFDPGLPDRIFLANDAGVYASSDRGEHWAFASGELDIAQLFDMDITENDPEIVACGGQETGVHYRTSGGQWRSIPFPTIQFDGTRVAIDAADPHIVYFSGQRGVEARVNGGLSRTLDAQTSVSLGTNGLTGKSPFVTILTIDPNPAIVDPANTRVMFVGGNRGLIPQLFRSTDAGQTWTRVEHAGTGTPFVPEGDIAAIEFDPGNSGIVYLGTTLGALYRTINGGATAGDWARVDAPDIAGAQISSIALDPADRGHIWVTFFGDGVTATDRPDVILPGVSHVYKTTDGGTTWTDAGGWLAWALPDVPTSCVVLDDQTVFPHRAYVGTDVGVYMTSNGGIVWWKFGDGLPQAPVTRLRLHRSARWLFAATMGRGVYRYKL